MSARSDAKREALRVAFAGATNWDMSRLNPYTKINPMRSVFNRAFMDEVARLDSEVGKRQESEDKLASIMCHLSTDCFTDNQLDQLGNAFAALLAITEE